MSKTVVYNPEDVIDRTVHVETFTEHIRAGEPFCHLRYGDGEFASALGILKGSNCDKHAYLHGTMGRELRHVLYEVADLHPDNRRIYVGLHCTWHQEKVQPWVVKHDLKDTVRWIGNIELQQGIKTLKTLEWLKVLEEYPGEPDGRVVLVGNGGMAPIARALAAEHVEIPIRNCYREIDRIERDCLRCCVGDAEYKSPAVFLVSASMAAECLIWRLYRHFPQHTYIDTGHVFDAMLGHKTRGYTRRNHDGILDVIQEHYAPLFDV